MKTFYRAVLCLTLLFVSAGGARAQASERERGLDLYRRGEYEKAVESLQKAVAAGEENAELRLFYAMALARSEREDEAVEVFKKILESGQKPSGAYDPDLWIIHKPAARYTDEGRKNNVQGRVKVAVEFTADGEIGFVFPFEKLKDGLTENVVEAVRAIRFEPAKKNGKPVTTVRILQYSFIIY